MIRNFAVVGPLRATRERLVAALAAAPDLAVYRIGRGADPMPVAATFDPADQGGSRSLLDWFERGAPAGSVLLVDDWKLCHDLDPDLDRVVQWIAALGPANGVQTVVTARQWDELPERLHRLLYGEATDFLALHGVEDDLSTKWQRRDYRAAVGVDERGWPVPFEMSIGQNGLSGAYLGADRARHVQALLLGLMVTHAPDDLQFVLIDGKGNGVYGNLPDAPHVAHTIDAHTPDDIFRRLQDGLNGEIARRQDLIHVRDRARNSWEYRAERDAGADLEPLADLMICVDSAEVLFERHPGFKDALDQFIRVGRTLGIRALISGDAYPDEMRVKIPEWPKALPTPDFAAMAEVLPSALQGGAIPHQLMLPPLHHSGVELTLEMVPHRAVGLIDKPYEQRRDAFYVGHTEDRRHGAIVGAKGTGKSTAMRTLAHALAPDIDEYQLLDGPGEPIDPSKHVVVTARTWDQVPQFIKNDLAFGIEFRLDDPATSLADPRLAAMVPNRPGFGLSVRHRLQVQIATP